MSEALSDALNVLNTLKNKINLKKLKCMLCKSIKISSSPNAQNPHEGINY